MLKNDSQKNPKVHPDLAGFNLELTDKGVSYVGVSQEQLFNWLNLNLHDNKLEHIYPDAPVFVDPPTRSKRKNGEYLLVQLKMFSSENESRTYTETPKYSHSLTKAIVIKDVKPVVQLKLFV